MIGTILVAAFLLSLPGCAAFHAPRCAPGETRSINDLLYFGTTEPDGVVTSEDWSEFLRTSVTPRFPQGLTAWPSSGQWQRADGTIIRETSFVLSLVHPDDDRSETAVRAIAAEYKAHFNQESVVRVKNHVCASF